MKNTYWTDPRLPLIGRAYDHDQITLLEMQCRILVIIQQHR